MVFPLKIVEAIALKDKIIRPSSFWHREVILPFFTLTGISQRRIASFSNFSTVNCGYDCKLMYLVGMSSIRCASAILSTSSTYRAAIFATVGKSVHPIIQIFMLFYSSCSLLSSGKVYIFDETSISASQTTEQRRLVTSSTFWTPGALPVSQKYFKGLPERLPLLHP